MTLVFNKKAWHYKLILYVWSEKFFLDTSEMNWKAIEAIDSTKIKDMTWHDFPRLEKPKTVNLCPYCRAVVASVALLPFTFVWRLFPHKPKKPRTHTEIIKASEKRSKIIRYSVAGGFGAFGVYKIIEGDYWFGAFYLVLTAFNMRSPEILKWIMVKTNPFLDRLFNWQHNRKKHTKPKTMKVTPEFFKKLSQKHEVICPPIFFVDVKDAEELV